jgi:hypothetical protein
MMMPDPTVTSMDHNSVQRYRLTAGSASISASSRVMSGFRFCRARQGRRSLALASTARVGRPYQSSSHYRRIR